MFKVHKAIICAKSEFFDKLCSSDFVEGANKRVTLDDEGSGDYRKNAFIYLQGQLSEH